MSQEARIDVELSLKQDSEAPSTEQAAEIAETLSKGVWFSTPPTVSAEGVQAPDEEWELVSDRPYLGRFATGRAAVYYGADHTGLVRPMIFADGFNYGPSDLPGLWEHFNAPYPPLQERFLDQLLASGVDVVLLGFDVRHNYIQANAGVAVSCIRRAIQQRQGYAPLIVGGVSMGGIITRYALATMERDGEDHQTETYLSYDSPHNGAWIPLILQQMAYFFEDFSSSDPGGPKQADLIRSPAAQQLLWGWVENSRYSGPVATASPLRGEFLAELKDLGWFPAMPRKLGVANGTANGTGRDMPPGELVFDWKAPLFVASATARIQPAYGERQRVGGMHFFPQVRRTDTTAVPPFDGAPGGTLASYGMIADALKTKIEDRYRIGCFVPTVSAVALNYDPVGWPIDLYTDVSALSPEESALDDFQCDTENSGHSSVSQTLVEWILAQITK